MGNVDGKLPPHYAQLLERREIQVDQHGRLVRLDSRHVATFEVEAGHRRALGVFARPVALTQAEGKRKGKDYYHQDFGWLREGRTREREAPENLGRTTFARDPESDVEPAEAREAGEGRAGSPPSLAIARTGWDYPSSNGYPVCPFDPACVGLLDDFTTAVRVRARDAPAHLCWSVARESTTHWLAASALLPDPFEWDSAEQARSAYLACWPIPIGRAALEHDADRWGEPELRTLRRVLAFEDHERALFATRLTTPDLVLDIFGLAELQPLDERATDVYTIGDLVWSARGRGDPEKSETLNVVKHAQRSWLLLRGTRLRGSPNAGRPKGSYKCVKWSRNQILEWWCQASERYADDDTQPTLRDLASAMGLAAEKTARKRVEAADLHWPPTADEIQAFQREHLSALELA